MERKRAVRRATDMRSGVQIILGLELVQEAHETMFVLLAFHQLHVCSPPIISLRSQPRACDTCIVRAQVTISISREGRVLKCFTCTRRPVLLSKETLKRRALMLITGIGCSLLLPYSSYMFVTAPPSTVSSAPCPRRRLVLNGREIIIVITRYV